MAMIRQRIRVDDRLATEDIIAFRRSLNKTDGRKVARRAAKFVARYMENNETPKSEKDHSYKRKGGERIIIKSGNLRKSTKIFTFSKSDRLHVGPRILRGFKGSQLGGSKKL